MRFGIVPLAEIEPQDVVLLRESVVRDPTGTSIQEILELVAMGEATMWRGFDEESRWVMVTQVVDYPAGRYLVIWHLAGEKNNIFSVAKPVQETLERYARRLNCTKTVAMAVSDVESMLEYLGYTKTHTRMEKEIT